MTQPDSLAEDVHFAVAIDLIGDLDATLGTMVTDTLASLIDEGATDVLVTTKHVSGSSAEGIVALDGAVGAARAKGCAVAVEGGNRKMRAAFAAAAFAVDAEVRERRRGARHLMIARHASNPKVARTG
jgi:anti-anti-sigma regulatory factor